MYSRWVSSPYDLELYHHGIKGQRWGIRRFQRYPRGYTGDGKFIAKSGSSYRQYKKISDHVHEDHVIPKGTKVYRMTMVDKETGEGSTYVTYQKADRDFYKLWIAQNNPTGVTYEKEFKLAEDLKVPSRDTVRKAYTDAVKEIGKKTVEDAAKEFIIGDRVRGNWKEAEKDYSKAIKLVGGEETNIGMNHIGDDLIELTNRQTGKSIGMNVSPQQLNQMIKYSDAKYAYDRIMGMVKDKTMSDFAIGMGTLTHNPRVKERMIKKLSSQGYNAMADEAGMGTITRGSGSKEATREAVEPLIVFDRASSLQERKTRKVDMRSPNARDRIYKGYRNYQRTMRRLGNRDPV